MEVVTDEQGRPAIEFCCQRCAKVVLICRPCWRNQKYCSNQCADEAGRDRNRRNQKNYRKTESGSENHKEAQKRYRLRQKYQD